MARLVNAMINDELVVVPSKIIQKLGLKGKDLMNLEENDQKRLKLALSRVTVRT